MMKKNHSRSERIFRALLRAFPFDFRWKHGREMEQMFRQRRKEEERQGGAMGTLKLWWETLADIARTAPREHLEILAQDVGFALRLMRKNLGFTAVAVLTLALGIGANTAIFSVVNAVLLRPLPFADEDRLVRLYDLSHREGGEGVRVGHSQRNFFTIREQAQSFESVAAQAYQVLSLTLDEGPGRVVCIGVSESWLETLGVQPIRGRGFSPNEEKAGSDSRVVLVSYGFWQRRLGGDPAPVGRTIVLDGQSHTIIGVMPRGFNYPYGSEMWRPRVFDPTNGRSHMLNAQARLKPGVTRQQAQAELDIISQRLEREYPETNRGYTLLLRATRDSLVDNNQTVILLLLVAVGFVLVIACANVANLLLARSVMRQKEFAVRAALGASRFRQLRQLLTESILLSLVGGALGVLFAHWVVRFLVALLPRRMSDIMDEVHIDTTVLVFSLLVAFAVGALVGLVPAFRVSRFNLQELLKEGGRSGAGSSGHRLLSALVVGEIALALVLLTGAGLMVQNLYRLQNSDLGFSTENLVSMQIAFPEATYADPSARIIFVQQALERVRALPGITGAGVINIFPFTDGNRLAGFALEGQPEDPDRAPMVNHRVVSPGYFGMMKVPLVRGRWFTERDSSNSQPVVLVSESMARRYWPGEDPVGKRVRVVPSEAGAPWLTVVGVVGDVVQPRLGDDIEETWYVPYAQSLEPGTSWTVMEIYLAVRTAIDPAVAVDSVKRAIWQVDKTLPVYDVISGASFYAETISPKRVSTILGVCFSALGLFMAVLGIYGVASYAVSQRTHEIGIRMALGAQPGDILRWILRQGILLVLLGVAIGLAGAVALTRFMSSLLSEVEATDPATFAGVAFLLAAVALLACYIPARRATKVDPMVALRCE